MRWRWNREDLISCVTCYEFRTMDAEETASLSTPVGFTSIPWRIYHFWTKETLYLALWNTPRVINCGEAGTLHL